MSQPRTRPVAVEAFGVLNLFFGIMGFLGIAGTAVFLFGGFYDSDLFKSIMRGTAYNPYPALLQDRAYMTWMKIGTPIGLIAAAALILAGAGLMKMKPWGRILSIWWAVIQLPNVIINLTFSYRSVLHPMLIQARTMSGPQGAGMIGGAITGIAGTLLALVYPTVLLIFMTRPRMKAALGEPAATNRTPSL